MRSKIWTLFAAQTFAAALMFAAQPYARSQTLTPFDPTGSTSTYPLSINPEGTVTGTYSDANYLNHGFVRTADGTITSFDAPGAAQGTVGEQINAAGTIVGYFTDANSVNHGFIRSLDGTLSVFDIPAAGAGSYEGTTPSAINAGGMITGYYVDASFSLHGFVRTAQGGLTTFGVGNQGVTFSHQHQCGGRRCRKLLVPAGHVRILGGAQLRARCRRHHHRQ